MFRFLIWLFLFAGSVYIMNTKTDAEVKEQFRHGIDWCKKNIKIEPAYRKFFEKTQKNSFPKSPNAKKHWRY